jgi:beta-aspartyl-dipeptidase (metallo-type)
MLSGKAGITHFHLGESPDRLAPLRALLDELHVAPELLYPSHVQRTAELLTEAVDLAKPGSFVDMDSAEEELGGCIRSFLEQDGPAERLTLSSDADSSAPKNLYLQVRAAVLEEGLPLEQILPLVTANPARVLKLQGKGKVEPGADADLVILRRDCWRSST